MCTLRACLIYIQVHDYGVIYRLVKSILKLTGNQCSDFNTGVMCALRLVLVRLLHSVLFVIDKWLFFGRPDKSELQ